MYRQPVFQFHRLEGHAVQPQLLSMPLDHNSHALRGAFVEVLDIWDTLLLVAICLYTYWSSYFLCRAEGERKREPEIMRHRKEENDIKIQGNTSNQLITPTITYGI